MRKNSISANNSRATPSDTARHRHRQHLAVLYRIEQNATTEQTYDAASHSRPKFRERTPRGAELLQRFTNVALDGNGKILIWLRNAILRIFQRGPMAPFC